MRNFQGVTWHKTQMFPDPRSKEDYITQVSEEREGRVTTKLSQDFSRTENHILGALSRLDDFLLNPLIQDHCGTAPETSQNIRRTHRGTKEDDSQSDPQPDASVSQSQTTGNSGPNDTYNNSFWLCFPLCNSLEANLYSVEYLNVFRENSFAMKI